MVVVHAVLRDLLTPDVESLRHWVPSEQPAIQVQAIVGPSDGPGDESFDLTLCTPAWLAQLAARDGIVDGRHHLVVADELDVDRIEAFIRKRIETSCGETWRDVAERVGRLGRWEFEDYAE